MFRLFFFILLVFNIYAEEGYSLLKEIPEEGVSFYKSLGNYNSEDYLKGAGFVTVAFLLKNYDEDFKEFKDKNRSDTLDKLSPIFRKYAEFYPQLILVTAGSLSGNEKAIKSGIYSAEAAIFASGITYLSKNIFARARPYTGEGADSWGNKAFDSDYSSFPSGHSTVAFATATVLANMYKDKKGIPELMYTLATLAALSRVYDDKHWLSDIFMGAGIGYFSGKLFINLKTKDGYIGPSGDGESFGIMFGNKF